MLAQPGIDITFIYCVSVQNHFIFPVSSLSLVTDQVKRYTPFEKSLDREKEKISSYDENFQDVLS